MKQSGKEYSVLEILDGMKQEIFLKREGHPRREWLPGGKHSGSLMIPEEQKSMLSVGELDLPASLRAALESGRIRKGEREIAGSDLRLKRFRRKKQVSILFLVDVSRSQGARERLSFAKSAVLSILKRAYSDRDRVGMVVFGNRKAELILPFTRSVDFAAKPMEELKAGGNTPLAMGIRKALKVLETEERKDPEKTVILVMLTDGKANFDIREGKPWSLALKAAGELKEKGVPVLVIDTENSVFGMGMARQLSDRAGGKYVKL